MFSKILIANRGEIACRIIKTAKKLGIKTVAVCSDVDLDSPHVLRADEFVNIGGSTSAESYLDIKKIIDALKKSNADAVHPGYGFLSENVKFSEEVNKAGKVFIGPPNKAISIMGDKIESKKVAFESGVSVVPGGLDIISSIEHALEESKKIDHESSINIFNFLNKIFPNKVALLHGKIGSEEKEKILTKFLKKNTQYWSQLLLLR